jgi:Flp pilus assembly protein TadG
VGIFGFAALAVDIGRLYSERRRAQNAADAAALAAGFTSTRPIAGLTPPYTQEQIDAAVLQVANDSLASNGYVNNPGTIDIQINHPPASGPYATNSDYYQVVIHQVVDKVFSQFVYNGPFQFTVEAVARVLGASSLSGSNAIRTLSPDGCAALNFDGDQEKFDKDGKIVSGGIRIYDGNVAADSTAGCPGRPAEQSGASCTSMVQNGGGTVTVTNGEINLSGTWRSQGSGVINSTVNTCEPQEPVPPVPTPDCSYLPVVTEDTYRGEQTLMPGQYIHGIKVTGNDADIHFTPGLYCLSDDMSMNNGNVTGRGVMFYMANGSFSVSGGTIANLEYPTSLPDHSLEGWNWAGMLIYMPKDNTGQVAIGGGSGAIYSGTIFAPGLPPNGGTYKCDIGGSGTSLNVDSSIICWNLKIHGSATFTLNYDQNRNQQLPASLDLEQ